ncbi:unnamed protein product, partial [Arctogadus glacialis]
MRTILSQSGSHAFSFAKLETSPLVVWGKEFTLIYVVCVLFWFTWRLKHSSSKFVVWVCGSAEINASGNDHRLNFLSLLLNGESCGVDPLSIFQIFYFPFLHFPSSDAFLFECLFRNAGLVVCACVCIYVFVCLCVCVCACHACV